MGVLIAAFYEIIVEKPPKRNNPIPPPKRSSRQPISIRCYVAAPNLTNCLRANANGFMYNAPARVIRTQTHI